jgi:hypothetical protein
MVPQTATLQHMRVVQICCLRPAARNLQPEVGSACKSHGLRKGGQGGLGTLTPLEKAALQHRPYVQICCFV